MLSGVTNSSGGPIRHLPALDVVTERLRCRTPVSMCGPTTSPPAGPTASSSDLPVMVPRQRPSFPAAHRWLRVGRQSDGPLPQ